MTHEPAVKNAGWLVAAPLSASLESRTLATNSCLSLGASLTRPPTMAAIEQEARTAGRSLLVLDTERGKTAEAMYEWAGWIRVGEIPEFACSPDGHLHGTVIFYRKI